MDENLIDPVLLLELSPNQTVEFDRKTLKKFSNKVLNWTCNQGHDYPSMVSNRSKGVGCGKCSGRIPIVGENDLATTHPHLAAEWHPTKNGKTKPTDIKAGGDTKRWWLGLKCGHEWPASPWNRSQGTGCAVCNGKIIVPGFNDLATLFPDIAVEWHPTKNGSLFPTQVAPKTNKEVWWLCSKGHGYLCQISNRTYNNRGCGKCSGRYAIPGENDIVTLYPDIAAEWHPTLNGDLKPEDVMPGSDKYVQWYKKSCGHSWKSQVKVRCMLGGGCSVCRGLTIVPGVNDLASLRPELAAEWDFEKNTLKPTEVGVGSNKLIHWVCSSCQYPWHTSVNHRTGEDGTGCPKCSRQISKAEAAITKYVNEELGYEVVTRYRNFGKKSEIDIYIPELKIGIEYNGVYYHSDRFRRNNMAHRDKYLLFSQERVQLIQLWEDDWNRDKALVKRVVKEKLALGAPTEAKPLKDVTFGILQEGEGIQFVRDNNLLQLPENCSFLGAFESGKLVSVLAYVLSEKSSKLEVSNFTSVVSDQHLFASLVDELEKKFKPNVTTAVSDNLMSDGVLYEACGFAEAEQLTPDYKLVINGVRVSKEDAGVLDVPRIWDAGKTRYVKLAGAPKSASFSAEEN